jgi:hypothetical protein
MAQIQPITTYEYLLYTTVRLELPLLNGEVSVGTGFIYDHQAQNGQKIPLLVTNKHVIKDSKEVKVRFHQRDVTASRWAVSGYVDLAFPLAESAWTGHPNPDVDLVGIRLSTFQWHAAAKQQEIAVFGLGPRFIPDDLSAFDAVEDIVMLGYPRGLWDSSNNYPLVRRGITSSHPGIDFEGKPEIAVDMACFPGSSGSPVLLPYEPSRAKRVAFFDETRLFAFLGVLFSGPQHPVPGQVRIPSPVLIETVSVIPMNLGFMIKAREIVTLGRHIEASGP